MVDGPVTIEVRVQLKRGVQDAEAESIEKSLRLLGLEGLSEVHTARVFSLTFTGISTEQARSAAQRAVEQLLANPVIHRVEIATLTT
ncbi:MAG TPA: phosphoribosylformylglycinamidine synthase subunit PurS [Thermoplasmata archaeon]|nr:phosphoribosylformylglycinamidine synthase subunit PurS [Thermoplasmata archaeon]